MTRAGFFPGSLAIASLLAATFLAGCDGPVDTAPVEVEVVVDGWVERGGEVALLLLREGVAVPAAEVVWSFDPEGSAELIEAGRARLLTVGTIRIIGTAGESSDSLTLEVGVPPRVVFDRVTDGNRDLWSVSLDGGELTRLTTNVGDDSDPTALADEIVFVSYRDGNAELYAIAPDGGDERRMTTTTEAELAPALAADGARVAYTSNIDGLPKLWLLTIASGDRVVAADGVPAAEIHASPAWRPGTDAVAFVTTATGSADIYSLSISSGEVEPLVTGQFADVEPAWNPAGEKLIFVSNRDGDTDLYLLDTADGEIHRLTTRPGTDAQPAWLADGRVVYIARDGAETRLRWLDPKDPERTYEIPAGPPDAAHPSAIQ
jgi:TolB protein